MSLGQPQRFTACSRISRPAFGRGSVFCSQTKELERGAPRDTTTGDENTNASFPNAMKTKQPREAAGLAGQGRAWSSLLLLPFPAGTRGCSGHILPSTFVCRSPAEPLAPSPATAKHHDSVPCVSAVCLKNRSKLPRGKATGSGLGCPGSHSLSAGWGPELFLLFSMFSMGDRVPPPHKLLPSPITTSTLVGSLAFLSWLCSHSARFQQHLGCFLSGILPLGTLKQREEKIPTICSCDTDLCFPCVPGGTCPGHGILPWRTGKILGGREQRSGWMDCGWMDG